MKPITIIMFGGALLIAFIVALVTYSKFSKKTEVETKAVMVKPEPVAVATTDLAWGTTLDLHMIKVMPYLKESLPAGHFTDPSDLVGRTVLYPISVNEPIFESRLAPTTVGAGGIAAVVKPSKRVMALKVNKIIGVAGFLHPGNRVDVLVTISRKPVITKTVLENMLILAIGPKMAAGSKKEKTQPTNVVTLEVTPEEAEKLALAVNKGSITLVLRNYADTEEVFTEGATIKTLLSSYKKASWAPEETGTETTTAGPPIYSIELIKGNNVSRVEF
jgi:pilus assembly protein CpaB